ncbi:MAG TPA: glucose 1-dehydrogenase [Dehalococcoidia bacterium]|nr:glucose 1-dehydrogenase [Dehalococcoidia bacterium]
MRLKGKVAFITGAGSGIGRSMALLFADEGAKVTVLDWNGDAGEETARLVREQAGEAIAIHGDVSQEADVESAVRRTVDTFGRLDVLVNDAAIEFACRATETRAEDWDRVHAINLRGVFLCCKHAIPHMQRRGGGAIVNIASVNGLVAVPAHAAYGAAKAGVIGLTRQLALDYGPDNIRVNCICPTTTDTPMARASADDQALEASARLHPLRRIARPEDVAYAALYLASDEAACVTGVALRVDGGATAV